MALRWTAASLLEAHEQLASHFKAYRQLPILRNALQEHSRSGSGLQFAIETVSEGNIASRTSDAFQIEFQQR